MTYLIWLVLVVVSFVVDLLGIFIVPIAIALSDGQRLPVWAWIWDNDREPLGDDTRGAAIAIATGFLRGWLRYCWLAFRNPGNNFGYLIGFVQSPGVEYRWIGDPATSDQGHPGWVWMRAYRDEALAAFNFYGVWRWGGSRCLRINLGWKIHDNADPQQREANYWKFAQIVLVINPFMTFEEAAA